MVICSETSSDGESKNKIRKMTSSVVVEQPGSNGEKVLVDNVPDNTLDMDQVGTTFPCRESKQASVGVWSLWLTVSLFDIIIYICQYHLYLFV